jgi:hypothetical protein
LDVRRGGALAACIALSGCSIPLADPLSGLRNSCSSNDDCIGAGGVCAAVESGAVCVTTKADLPEILLEVKPSKESAYGPQKSHYILLQADAFTLPSAKGVVVTFDPPLPQYVGVTLLVDDIFAACPQGQPFSAEVVLRPVPPPFSAGLASARYSSKLLPAPAEYPEAAYIAKLDVPVGDFDIYILPGVEFTECAAPIFIPVQPVVSKSTFVLNLGPPSELIGKITTPPGMVLQDWLIDLVEPEKGLRVSTTQKLAQVDLSPDADLHLSFYSPNVDSLDKVSPILQLRPPDGAAQPKVFWDLGAADPLNTQNLSLTLENLDTRTSLVGVQAVDGEGMSVPATIKFQSKALSLPNAWYQTTAVSGDVPVELPLGTYEATAYPLAGIDKAITKSSLVVGEVGPDECQCGIPITVLDQRNLLGTVLTPLGIPLSSASVTARRSPDKLERYVTELDLSATTPKDATTALGISGEFALRVSPGKFDLWVRPQESSGYPWLVRSRVQVNEGADADLNTMEIAYPAILKGTIVDPASGQPIPGAAVNAWVRVKDPNAPDAYLGTVVQIAETTSSEDGGYLLSLPPSILQ